MPKRYVLRHLKGLPYHNLVAYVCSVIVVPEPFGAERSVPLKLPPTPKPQSHGCPGDRTAGTMRSSGGRTVYNKLATWMHGSCAGVCMCVCVQNIATYTLDRLMDT